MQYSHGDVILYERKVFDNNSDIITEKNVGLVISHRICRLADDQGQMHVLFVLWEDGNIKQLHSAQGITLISSA